MDRRLLVALLVLFIYSPSAFASSFPFTIVRASNGKLDRIELPASKSRQTEDVLTLLRAAVSRPSLSGIKDELSSVGLNKKEEIDAFEEAKRVLGFSVSKSDLEDPRLDVEFAKAKLKLDGLFVYRLLANPYNPGAFDKENAVKEAVEQLLEAAKLIFTVTPPMRIFEFLVDEHLDALEARREFHQNRILSVLDKAPEFSIYEKSLVRSSIYYSRLWIVNPIARKDARKVWNTYGDTQWKKSLDKCKGYTTPADRSYGPCFKVDGTEIRNRLVNSAVLSKSTSLAYDFNAPTRVRNTRIAWLMVKLGMKFVPAPSWIKGPVNIWIKSHYQEQRRSEGFAYQSALDQGQADLASWIVVGNANPILMP